MCLKEKEVLFDWGIFSFCTSSDFNLIISSLLWWIGAFCNDWSSHTWKSHVITSFITSSRAGSGSCHLESFCKRYAVSVVNTKVLFRRFLWEFLQFYSISLLMAILTYTYKYFTELISNFVFIMKKNKKLQLYFYSIEMNVTNTEICPIYHNNYSQTDWVGRHSISFNSRTCNKDRIETISSCWSSLSFVTGCSTQTINST